jgi:hypothetical protein
MLHNEVMAPSEDDGLGATLGEAHRRYTRHINFHMGDELFMAMLEKVTGRDLPPKWPGRPAADREK